MTLRQNYYRTPQILLAKAKAKELAYGRFADLKLCSLCRDQRSLQCSSLQFNLKGLIVAEFEGEAFRN